MTTFLRVHQGRLSLSSIGTLSHDGTFFKFLKPLELFQHRVKRALFTKAALGRTHGKRSAQSAILVIKPAHTFCIKRENYFYESLMAEGGGLRDIAPTRILQCVTSRLFCFFSVCVFFSFAMSVQARLSSGQMLQKHGLGVERALF